MVEFEFLIHKFDVPFACLLEYNSSNKFALELRLLNIIFFIFEWLVGEL
jgi:hypothetical protein